MNPPPPPAVQASRVLVLIEEEPELFCLACNDNAVPGQVTVIKINSEDFSCLWQGQTRPSRESKKERAAGLFGRVR